MPEAAERWRRSLNGHRDGTTHPVQQGGERMADVGGCRDGAELGLAAGAMGRDHQAAGPRVGDGAS
jgi:hypothetical protein